MSYMKKATLSRNQRNKASDMSERTIGEDEHVEHHEFLRECIPLLKEYLEDRKRTREQWEKFRTSFLGAIASAIGIAFVSALAWIGNLVLHALRNGGQ